MKFNLEPERWFDCCEGHVGFAEGSMELGDMKDREHNKTIFGRRQLVHQLKEYLYTTNIVVFVDETYGKRNKKAKPIANLRLNFINSPFRRATASTKMINSVMASNAAMNCQRGY